MLLNLHIKNFTIIDDLEINFSSGMTVLTGETGAGKSIIIDTLELVLGGRGDVSVIRQGCENCEIVAIFSLSNPEAIAWLTDHELNSDQECIIRRTINRDGRSKMTINGIPIPQQLVRELGMQLVNIHGQHEQQNLLQRQKQLSLLDNYADHQKLLTQLAQTYQHWVMVNSDLEQLQKHNNKTRFDFLTYQIEEFDKLNLNQDELPELYQEHKQLANATQIIQTCDKALTNLENNQLLNARNLLNLDVEQVNNINKLLDNALLVLNEAIRELQHFLNNLEVNPDRLQWIEKRLDTIFVLARKHQIKPEDLYGYHQQLKQQLNEIVNAEDNILARQRELVEATKKYQEVAKQLSESRQNAAKKLAIEITELMHQLNMHEGKFAINILPKQEFSASGLEQIEFLVAMNRGQPSLSLNKVASGGELSRLSLAIQVITAQQFNTPTLVFDEIDSGIGGKTAQIVGQLLKQLGRKTQVFCVTHLPQIAALGDHHFQVSKEFIANTTISKIMPLEGENKILEIARMLGGVKITKQTLAHAKELCLLEGIDSL